MLGFVFDGTVLWVRNVNSQQELVLLVARLVRVTDPDIVGA